MGQPTHVMNNWRHYWEIANSREDLKELKNILEVHYNKPGVDIFTCKINTKDGVKTVNELLHELKPNE